MDYECYPTSLSLPAESGPFPVKVMGTPKSAGTLTVHGESRRQGALRASRDASRDALIGAGGAVICIAWNSVRAEVRFTLDASCVASLIGATWSLATRRPGMQCDNCVGVLYAP